MTQFQQEYALYRNRFFWSVIGVVLLIAFMTVNVTHAGQIVLQLIFVHADTQMVDTDGDGRLDPFSADLKVYDDGTAAGVVRLNKVSDVTLKRGVFSCQDGEATAVLTGVERQYNNGQWIEGGDVEIKVQPATDSSASGTMIWSLDTDDFQFYSNGKFLVARDFCDEQ